jgi:hypothetical protein
VFKESEASAEAYCRAETRCLFFEPSRCRCTSSVLFVVGPGAQSAVVSVYLVVSLPARNTHSAYRTICCQALIWPANAMSSPWSGERQTNVGVYRHHVKTFTERRKRPTEAEANNMQKSTASGAEVKLISVDLMGQVARHGLGACPRTPTP